MDKRMIAIVEDLVRRILREAEPVGNSGEIVQSLLKQGYALDEIQQAFAWIFSDQEIISDEKPHEQLYNGERIFSSAEIGKLSFEFRSSLLRYHQAGLLSKNEMEKVLVEAMVSKEAELGEKDLYSILARIVGENQRLLLMIPQSGGEEH
jgi:uncharacterized protein Smg (DUF494 family)